MRVLDKDEVAEAVAKHFANSQQETAFGKVYAAFNSYVGRFNTLEQDEHDGCRSAL